jgi:phage repressor protein C with HTH and peptisase S24 domain
MGLSSARLAEQAGVNRSFVYDILRGRSANPSAEKLSKIADVLRVESDWLLRGIGDVEGDDPLADGDYGYVQIRSARVTASMGAGSIVEDDVEEGEPYHFRRAWIRDGLKAAPDDLRILHVEGDSMEPTLTERDIVLIDSSRTTPTPPGIFVLFDGMGLVAKRLEHIPNSDPPMVRIISDNARYSAYERTADEINIVGRIRWFAREM